jgi:hypothetical protein
MALVKQKDNRSGITYAYEATYWWDKEKQQSRRKCMLIGRVDTVTGEIVPTDGRNKTKKESAAKPKKKRGPHLADETRRMYFGATYLLESFADQLGVTDDLM